jgi:TMEM175 potassium channel family protein
VFGVAITLLVVDVAIHPPGTALQQVFHAWPAYLAYAITFLTIGGAWLLHDGLTDQLARTDQLFLRLNLLLLVVVFLPFPTRLVAEALHNPASEQVFVTMYGLTLLVMRLLGFALDAFARHEHLYSPAEEGEEVQTSQRKLLPVIIGYVIAIIIGLFLPTAGVVLYFGIAVYLVVPLREVAQLISRRSWQSSANRTEAQAEPAPGRAVTVPAGGPARGRVVGSSHDQPSCQARIPWQAEDSGLGRDHDQ